MDALPLCFVDPDPTRAIPLKLHEVVRQQEAAINANKPLPVLPPEMTAAEASAAGEHSSSAVEMGAQDWVDADEEDQAAADAVPALAAKRQTTKTLSQLIAVRTRVMADLATAAKQLTPKVWSTDVMPRIERYLSMLTFLAENNAPSPAYFYWHPAESAINNVWYEAAGIHAAVGACELRAAATLVRRAGDAVANATHLAARNEARTAADEDRRLAYKLACSAADRFRRAAELMLDKVEPELVVSRDSSEDSPTSESKGPNVHPALSSDYYRTMQYLSLGHAQEVGVLRAASQKDDDELGSTQSLAHPQPGDALAAGLATRAAELYDMAVRCVRQVPAPKTTSAKAACANVFDQLETVATAKAAIWLATSHVLLARANIRDNPVPAMAHASKAYDKQAAALAAAKKLHRADKVICTETVARLAEKLEAHSTAIDGIRCAVERLNSIVSHANPKAEDMASATPAAAKELARPKPYAFGV